jgi:hypothetical protein
VDRVDDLGAVDALQVDRGDAEVGVSELALDDEQGHTFPGHFDGVCVAELPAGAGLEFPYLSAIHDLFEPLPRRGVRTTLTRGLSRPDRAAVYRTWDQAHDWMARWLGDRA